MRREAKELASSPLTRRVAHDWILRHNSLPDALAAMVSSKVANELAPQRELERLMASIYAKPQVQRAVVADLAKAIVVDPAAEGVLVPAIYFKGFHALATYRVANDLWCEGSKASRHVALLLQSRASELFAVDIHPAASIGPGVMLDHGTGVVIGATAVLGADLYILHNVTLGATGKPMGSAKRHPTVGDGVTLGAGCTVLGDIIVGDGATVGGGAIVTKAVPPGGTVIGSNKLVSRAQAASKSEEKGEEIDPFTWYYSI